MGCIQRAVSHEVVKRSFPMTVRCGICNGEMPTVLRSYFAPIKATRFNVGNIVVPTRSEVRGPCYGLGEGGGAVTLMVALMPCHAVLPEHAPFFLVPFRTTMKRVRM